MPSWEDFVTGLPADDNITGVEKIPGFQDGGRVHFTPNQLLAFMELNLDKHTQAEIGTMIDSVNATISSLEARVAALEEGTVLDPDAFPPAVNPLATYPEPATVPSGTVLYASPAGGGDGLSSGSPTTLDAALASARSDTAVSDIVLADGEYDYSDEALALSAAGGTNIQRAADNRLLIRAANVHGARIIGGKKITGWSLMTSGDSNWARFPAAAQGEVYVADLASNGVDDVGTHDNRGFAEFGVNGPGELYIGIQRQNIARWPNREETEDVEGAIPKWVFGHYQHEGGSGTTFPVPADKAAAWEFAVSQANTKLMAHGYWGEDWADSRVEVDSVDSGTNTAVRIGTAHQTDDGAGAYYVYNLPEELDEPGEYWVDPGIGKIYFWPSDAADLNVAYFSMADGRVLTLGDCSYMAFKDVEIGLSRNHIAAVFSSSDHIFFHNCNFFGSGRSGVSISGSNCTVAQCHFTGIGLLGVSLNGGDKQTLTPANNFVYDCDFEKFSLDWYCYGGGIELNGVGNTAALNRIDGGYHLGIIFRGNNHNIVGNYLSNLCQFSNDAAAIYAGREFASWGNEIKYNCITEVRTKMRHFSDFPDRPQTHDYLYINGIYLDDCMPNVWVRYNVISGCDQRGIVLGGGVANIVEDNIIINCITGCSLDGRGDDQWVDNGGTLEIDRPGQIRKVADTGDESWDMQYQLSQVPYQSPPWSDQYPILATIPTDWDEMKSGGWFGPKHTIFRNNSGEVAAGFGYLDKLFAANPEGQMTPDGFRDYKIEFQETETTTVTEGQVAIEDIRQDPQFDWVNKFHSDHGYNGAPNLIPIVPDRGKLTYVSFGASHFGASTTHTTDAQGRTWNIFNGDPKAGSGTVTNHTTFGQLTFPAAVKDENGENTAYTLETWNHGAEPGMYWPDDGSFGGNIHQTGGVWHGSIDGSGHRTGNNTGRYPDDMLDSAWRTQGSYDNYRRAYVILGGLSLGKSYSIYMLGNAEDTDPNATAHRTRYRIGGRDEMGAVEWVYGGDSDHVNDANVDGPAKWLRKNPQDAGDGTGFIVLGIERYNSNFNWAWLSVLEIEEHS